MTINPNSIISISWAAPSRPRYSTVDTIIPGFIFGGDEPLNYVDRFEVEIFNPNLNTFVNQGYFYTPEAEFQAGDLEDARIRIRAITRDGVKSEFTESGTFSMNGFTSLFGEVRNIIFLSFV